MLYPPRRPLNPCGTPLPIVMNLCCEKITDSPYIEYIWKMSIPICFIYSLSLSLRSIGISTHIYHLFTKMADNIHYVMQDIDLQSNDAPFVLPLKFVWHVAEEWWCLEENFALYCCNHGKDMGFRRLVCGNIIKGKSFQFIFPLKEAMKTVIRRIPWASSERMLVLQRWTLLMDMDTLNFIQFWIQIRGIPFPFMNREVILNIAWEYNEEMGGRLELIRMCLN